MENIEENSMLVQKNILQISHNKKFAFLTIEENKNIILNILPVILENLGILECKVINDEKFDDFVLNFYHKLTPNEEKNIQRLELIIKNLNNFLAQNRGKKIIIEDYIKYVFEKRTLN